MEIIRIHDAAPRADPGPASDSANRYFYGIFMDCLTGRSEVSCSNQLLLASEPSLTNC